MFLMDPGLPKEDPNDMLKRMGGNMTDPHRMNHNCPICNKTMNWELFCNHAEACYRKWRSVKLNTKGRIYRGAAPRKNV